MKAGFPEYIVVEGPIGVGKTSLAKNLADSLQVDLLLENAEENPFLPAFYENPSSAALPTQLHFLFQRVKQVEALKQTDLFRSAQIADYLLDKDRLFARVTLSDPEFDIYKQVYERMALATPIPDLVIYLQAPVDTLMERISRRGIDYEKYINEKYLKKISDAYVDFFYHYSASPLLIINTEHFNLVDDDSNYKMLLEHIQKLPPGKHYLNPQNMR